MHKKLAVGLLLLGTSGGSASALDLDATFGTRGVVEDRRLNGVSAVALQPDGKTIVATHGDGEAVLARYRPNGAVDTSFGDEGLVTAPSFPLNTRIADMALQSDGRILIAGSAQGKFFVARFLSNGDPDSSFGSGGFASAEFPPGYASASSIALQPDGKIVLAGSVDWDPFFPTVDYAAARFEPDGLPDTTFGNGGRVTVDMDGRLPENVQGLGIRADGHIVLAGLTENGCGILGLLPNGLPDPSFAANGKLFLAVGAASDCGPMALQRDGLLVVGGGSDPGGAFAARLRPDGSRDAGFGIAGIAMLDAHGPVADVALDGAGRIVLAITVAGDAAVGRLHPNGAPDLTVGPAGWVRAPLVSYSPHYYSFAASVVAAPNGTILLGVDRVEFSGLAALVRYVDLGVTAIPTLSEAVLTALAVLLGLCGVVVLRRGA